VRPAGPESRPILDGVDLDVAPGTLVAIVGRSGAGKTTLAKCLVGLVEPSEGSVRYDGVDLRDVRWRDLRRQVGFVLQDNYLFDDTIARNVAFGDEAPDAERVRWAARVANADAFVERLPLGYDTRVGETGLALSAGQRQRLAIARAVYGRPPVLVLDEATSALDVESERLVRDNLDRVLAGRTAFVIAHRLSTVQHADLILVVEEGRIAERGTHDELLRRRGLYHFLFTQRLAE
jgi:ATP-binding cassette subfamily B protein